MESTFSKPIDDFLVNDLTTGGTTKALTAEMGKTLNSNTIRFTLTELTLVNNKASFDPDSYKGIYVLVDNGSTACYEPNFLPSTLLKLKENRNFIMYGESTSEYFAVKYASNEITVTSNGFTRILNVYAVS